ncbi:5-bromo-4-chloroindolyl phosphate hydrolysis family protein [Sporosarcina thermotolerans]|uniref:5-bromo-4-chloroindolyl phosphate hydrolysis family protein n=1 Tax=Sporosarcina thermotolerans TaxID=633404 RepID=A0AAW9A3M6_9BACL|nr:5-bromo-4-chloroindolyl phosphate hydrolysis family protein [Sporosarcina thermotolerans]MDW0115442.1 5-bromo-4-chloroindolyl phosphate hydrolysis family protein [Sporosarcina thermotolerans]WHT47229.1 5-bromo-4-chloroindolyl phosphate hydrolysis family protein [Sporosarcina thermotolerans]
MKEVKQFFQRHLITAPISFGSWLTMTLAAGMNPLAATGLMIAIYLGGNFTIKQIQLSSNVKELGMSRSEFKHIKSQMNEAKTKINKLNGLYGQVRSVQAFKQVYEINNLAKRILTIVRKNPKKFYHVEKFFYSHLDSAVELTSKYAILVNQPLKDQEIRVALQHTRETLNDVNRQLEQDLRGALATDIEQLQLELDYVDVTMKKNKPLLEMKGEMRNDRE